ncbi:MAG TPA: hypothetical protein DCQ06_05460, partial [Myxococcales bacterium]|nr:hypothetical protein [Myxococcales bacterium]
MLDAQHPRALSDGDHLRLSKLCATIGVLARDSKACVDDETQVPKVPVRSAMPVEACQNATEDIPPWITKHDGEHLMARRDGFMHTPLITALAACVLTACGASQPKATAPAAGVAAIQTQVGEPTTTAVQYPKARRGEVIDDYHGTKVADPYRWLEDPDSKETSEWVAAQNKLFHNFVGAVPYRQRIRSRLSKLWNYERFSSPTAKGGGYFFRKNDGLQNQSVLYRSDALGASGQVVLDPNTLSKDGTVALKGGYLSEDGRYLAWQTAASGSDWTEIRVRDVRTGKDLADHIKWVKFSRASWRRDGSGFYYSRYDEPKKGQALKAANYFQKLYFHRLGTEQSEDQLVYHRPDHKDWGFGGAVSDDDRWLIISVWRGASSRNQVFVQRLDPSSKRKANKRSRRRVRKRTASLKVQELISGFDQLNEFLGSRGDEMWFKTDHNAPRGRIIQVNVNKPQSKYWKEIVPQAVETLHRAQWVGGKLFCTYLKDAHSVVKLYDLKGKPDAKTSELALPTHGTVGSFSGGPKSTETFYAFTSFTYPTTIFRYDLKSGKSQVWRAPKVDFNPNDYVTKQVFVRSKDGTKVPAYLVHKAKLPKDGKRPVYLYAYGGFNISLTPTFRVARLQWLEMGGVYVLANLRGGGEYGEVWHKAGMRGNKQNVFDDFSS